MAAKSLNHQQALFAQLLTEGMGKAEAYRAVYPGNYTAKSCATKAARLARHPLIAQFQARRTEAVLSSIDRAVERYGITSDRVADAMARLAFTNLCDIVTWRTVQENGKKRVEVEVHDAKAISNDAHQAIAELRRSAGGEITVKLFNKREALMDIARLKGWIADKPVDQRNLVMLKIER